MRKVSLFSIVITAVVASCARPPVVAIDHDEVPTATVSSDVVAGWSRDGDLFVSPVLATPEGALRVAAIVRTQPHATVRLFARDVDSAVFAPMTVTWRDDAHDDDRAVARVDLASLAHAVVIAVHADDITQLRSITYEAMVPQPARDASDITDATSTVTQAVLNGFQPRSAWGARAANGCSANTAKTKVTVHHTVSRLHEGGTAANWTAEIRSAQALHMDGRGYCDIGYHFLVSADGTVWEGRNASHLGAHTGGQNTDNLGVSFVGCFHPTSDCNGLGSTTPPQVMLNGAGTFIGIAARHYGITLREGTTLLGHRDNPGQATACPGDSLRSRLGELATIAGGSGAGPATTGKVQGVVWDLSITPDAGQATAANAKLPGSLVRVVQGATEVQRATARDGDAYWSFDLTPGNYRVIASRDGFAEASKDIAIAAGAAPWSSLGLAPTGDATDVAVTVTDVDTGAPLSQATVQFGNDSPVNVDGQGIARATLTPGSVRVTARAEGYLLKSETITLVRGQAATLTLALTLDTVEFPDDEEPIDEPDTLNPAGSHSRIVIRNAPNVGGGCGCSGAPDVALPFGLAALLFARRRSRQDR